MRKVEVFCTIVKKKIKNPVHPSTIEFRRKAKKLTQNPRILIGQWWTFNKIYPWQIEL
jgi:hypothetical protein